MVTSHNRTRAFNDRDFNAQSCMSLRHFNTDKPAANDDQMIRFRTIFKDSLIRMVKGRMSPTQG